MKGFLKIFKLISRIVLPRIITIGVDVQDRHITTVATIHKGDATEIITYGMYEIKEGAIKNGEIKEPRVLEEAIRLFTLKIPQKRFIADNEYVFTLSIPPNHLYAETVSFPEIAEKDLAAAVGLKLETSLPWPVKKAYTDWNRVKGGADEEITVFIAAIARSVLDEYVKIFFRNGWKLAACEFHMLSLAKFISREEVSSFIFALIDEDGIEFAVFHAGSILVHYLQPVQEPDVSQKILEEKLNQLASYTEGNFGLKIEKIFVFDKLSREHALDSVQTRTGIAAQSFTPPPHLDPRLFIAIGASFRSYSTKENSINLLPAELGGRYEQNLFLKTLSLWTNIFFVFNSIFTIAFGSALLFLWQEGKTLEFQMARSDSLLGKEIELAQPLLEKATYFNKLTSDYKQANLARSSAGKMAETVYGYVIKSGLQFISATADMQGNIMLSVFAPTRGAALAFQELVKNDKSFAPLSIPITQLAQEKNITLTFSLKEL